MWRRGAERWTWRSRCLEFESWPGAASYAVTFGKLFTPKCALSQAVCTMHWPKSGDALRVGK